VTRNTSCTQSSPRIDAESRCRSAKSKDAVTLLPLELRGTSNLCNFHSSIESLSTLISLTMSLRDLACYTLTLKPHEQDSKVTELVSVENGREEHRFARVREVRDGEAYSSSIYGMSFDFIYSPFSSLRRLYVAHSCIGADGLTIDALTGAKLASVGFISDKQKNRRLQLHNPDESVGFDNTSKMYVYPPL
jgi:hypothetical protein